MTNKPYTRFSGATPETMIEIAPNQYVTKVFYDRYHGKTKHETRTNLSDDHQKLPASEAGQDRTTDSDKQQG